MMKKFMPLGNMNPPHAGKGEAAFRRGYQHGAIYVLRAIKEGVDLAKVEAFIKNDLREWRDRPNDPAFPPEIKQ